MLEHVTKHTAKCDGCGDGLSRTSSTLAGMQELARSFGWWVSGTNAICDTWQKRTKETIRLMSSTDWTIKEDMPL